jgi:hypothetical protein
MLVAAAALPASAPPLSYWGLVVVTGVLVAVIAALLVWLIPLLRKSGARDEALDALLALGPDLEDLIKAFNGDTKKFPPVQGLGYQIGKQSKQIDFLALRVPMSPAEQQAYGAITGGPS